ncbi:MAG: nucleotidyltransferase family protein [Rickettsiales bacterium]
MAHIRTAICFCAGMGTRMRPYTYHAPKSLLPLAGRSLLARHVDALAASGVRRIIVNAHYMAEKVEYHVKSLRRRFPALSFVYVREEGEAALETGGGVVNALPHIDDAHFYAVNADALFPPNAYVRELRRLRDARIFFDEDDAHALLLQPIGRQYGYAGKGDFSFSEGARIYLSKGEKTPCYVFSGMQLLSRHYFTDKPRDVWSLKSLYRDPAQRLYGVVSRSAPWLHVGDPAALAQAERYVRRLTFKEKLN